jgi:hypothetical protein
MKLLSKRMEADEKEGRHSVLIVTFIHHRMAKMLYMGPVTISTGI